jgi:PAS domain S-box-containing protein
LSGEMSRQTLQQELATTKARLQELEARARQYDVTLQTLAAGVIVHGPDGKIRSANQQARTTLGLDQTDPAPQWELRDASGKQLAREEFPANVALRSKQAINNCEIEVYRHDLGRSKWFSTNAAPVLNAQGEIEEVVVTFIDISQTRAAVNALKISEHRFRSILDNAHNIAVQGYDQQRRVIYWNQASESFYGYPNIEAVGQKIEELLLPIADRAEFIENFDEMLKHDTPPAPCEYVATRKDGSHIDIYSNQVLIHLPDGSREMYCIDLDLTETRDLEQELARYYSRFRAISETSALGVFATDSRGQISYANVNFQKLVNRAASELLDKPWLALVHKANQHFAESSWQQAKDGMNTLTLELSMTAGDTVRWLRLNGAPLRDGRDSGGYVMTVEDISQRKEMEKAIRESEEKFSRVYQTLPDALVITNLANGEILDVNRQWELVTGYSPAESIGNTTFALNIWANPEDRASVVADIRAGREVRMREFLARTKHGMLTWCEYSAVPIELGGEQLLISVLRDITDRWTIATALRDSEEKFSKAFHLMPDLVVFTDYETGRYLDMNDQLLPLLGISREEALGKTSEELDIWADTAQRDLVIETLSEFSEVRLLEVQLRRKDQQLIWCEYSAIPCELGGKRMLMSIVRDITDRKSIAQALHDSEQKFATVYQMLPDALGITDLQTGLIIDANKAWLEITGWGPDECIGKRTKDLGVWANPQDRKQLIANLKKNRLVTHREFLIRKKDGTVSWSEISGVIATLSGRQVLIWVLRDIHARWEIAQALRHSEEKLSKAFHLLPDTLMLSDLATGAIVDLNERWDEITGMHRQRAIGYSLIELGLIVHPEEWQIINERLNENNEVRNQILKLRRKDEQIVEVEYSGVPIEVQGQKVAMGILRDVTEKQQIERELRDLNVNLEYRVQTRTAELESANAELQSTLHTLQLAQNELVRAERLASLGSLVAGVAHELNTPIGNSVTVASTLQEKTRDFKRDMESGTLKKSGLLGYIDTASTASDLLMRNLQQARELIASFKQVAVDQTSEKRRRFDLKEVIEEVVSTLHPMLKKSPHQIHLQLEGGIQLDSFPGPLGQVVTNLVNNAVIHAFDTRAQGDITIEAYAAGDDIVEIQIQDNGSGIPQHHLPRIFDPFFTTRLGKGGSGLGLHIVYSIVTRVLGGRIHVKSRPSAGTLFTIQIPLVAPATAKPEISE